MYISVVLSKFMLLENRSPELFLLQNRNLVASKFFPSSLPRPQQLPFYFFVSMNLVTLYTSDQWNHTALFFCDWLSLKVHQCCGLLQDFLLLRVRIIFHYMIRPHFVYSFIHQWTSGWLPYLVYCA